MEEIKPVEMESSPYTWGVLTRRKMMKLLHRIIPIYMGSTSRSFFMTSGV